MAQKKIYIVWKDGRTIDIQLEDNPVAEFYYQCVKHLQHVDLEFNARKNPLQLTQTTKEEIIVELVSLGETVNLSIDKSQIDNQEYLNKLHTIYFENAQQKIFDTVWLKIHDCIHILEEFNDNGIPRNSVWFDYESKSGPLIKKFDREYLKYSTTDIVAGMCFIREHELGKSPNLYKQHNESLDIDTVCTQAKPWTLLRPVLDIAYCNGTNYNNFNEAEFNQWFAPVKDRWCKHWAIKDWEPKEMFSVIPVGTINNLPEFVRCFTESDYPQRLAI